MPFDLIAKGGISVGLLLILSWVVYQLFVYFTKSLDKNHERYEKLVNDISEQHNKREEEHKKEKEQLMLHIQRSDENQSKIADSIKEISRNMAVMQEDIRDLKDICRR